MAICREWDSLPLFVGVNVAVAFFSNALATFSGYVHAYMSGDAYAGGYSSAASQDPPLWQILTRNLRHHVSSRKCLGGTCWGIWALQIPSAHGAGLISFQVYLFPRMTTYASHCQKMEMHSSPKMWRRGDIKFHLKIQMNTCGFRFRIR